MLTRSNVPLSNYSNFGVGGNAKTIITANSSIELAKIVSSMESFEVFAGGTNVVFPDEGLTETLIQIKGGNIEINNTDLQLTADSGVLLMDVVNKAIELGWGGMENLSGIPGTIGGAVYGNAGAYGIELKDIVDKVEVYYEGKCFWLTNLECQFKYRFSIFKQKGSCPRYVILRVRLKLVGKVNSKELQDKSKTIIQTREQKYPKDLKCPGSYFKNLQVDNLSEEQLRSIPKEKIMYGKIPAGFFLEEVGAKGMEVGGIKVADYHANLIYNTGNGKAREAKELAKILKQLVFDKFKIMLEEEVSYF